MLINIHKGSLPDSSSTTYSMGASLADTLFSFVYAMYADWVPPHLSLVVCYIFHILVPLLCKTWFCKVCNRNCKNPVLDVIRTLSTSDQAIYYNPLNIYFSSLIDLDTLIIMSPKIDAPYLWTTIRLCPLKFSLRAIIDHHGPSIHSGHYTASINCCKKNPFYCNDHTITEFRIIDSKNFSTAYVILYDWLTHDFWTRNKRVGVWSLPWRWHILSIPLTIGRGTGAKTCGLDVSSWWPLLPSRSSVFIYIYIYYNIYIYAGHIFLGILFSLVYQLCLALWW